MKKNLPLLSFFLALCAGVFSFLLFILGAFSHLEFFLEDALFSRKPISEDIIILAIDDESLQKIGQWPWPREVFAKALHNAKRFSPKAVGVDVIFADPSRVGRKDDSILASLLPTLTYPLVFPLEGEDLLFRESSLLPEAARVILPLQEFLPRNVSLGHVNLLLDGDGVVRRFPREISFPASFLGGQNEHSEAFSLVLFEKSFPERSLETSKSQSERIVFSAPPGSVRRIPFWRLFEGTLPEDAQGKIFLIGATSPDLHDEKRTAFSRGTEMPGVEIQANILNQYLLGYSLRPLSSSLSFLFFVASALLPLLFFLFLKRLISALLSTGVLLIFLSSFIAFLFDRGIVVGLVHAMLSVLLSATFLFLARYALIEREKREIRNIFSKYVSVDVLESILLHPEKVSLGGEEREVTVFFSDIRGFTTLSEKTTPTELVSILNDYFSVMSHAVLQKRGVLDKYIGDAIMAFWGAPVKDPLQAEHAVEAGLLMLGELQKFNERLFDEKGIRIDIGIGIYTGKAVVGNIGSESRYDYTVMGDTVNVAARLEGLNKEHGTHILIGESTKEKLSSKFKVHSIGKMLVKGRLEPVSIYSVSGSTE